MIEIQNSKPFPDLGLKIKKDQKYDQVNHVLVIDISNLELV
jgi:hypothetical protein